MAVADLSITTERLTAVEFSMPWMNLGISIVYIKPRKVIITITIIITVLTMYNNYHYHHHHYEGATKPPLLPRALQ